MKFCDRPLAFTDLETTGLKKLENRFVGDDDFYTFNEICEIGLVLVDQKSLKTILEWEEKVQIQVPNRASDEALKINGYNDEDWKNAMELSDALKEYNERTKEAVFVAQNPTFDDWGFMELAFTKYHIVSTMDYHRIDLFTYTKATLDAKGYPPLPSHSLGKVANFLGVPEEPMPHRALNGAQLAFEVYKKLQTLPHYSNSTHPRTCCQQDIDPYSNPLSE